MSVSPRRLLPLIACLLCLTPIVTAPAGAAHIHATASPQAARPDTTPPQMAGLNTSAPCTGAAATAWPQGVENTSVCGGAGNKTVTKTPPLLKPSFNAFADPASAWGRRGISGFARSHIVNVGDVTVSGFVFEVDSAAALREVLATATGGDTVILADGDYGFLKLSQQFSETVTIQAAEGADVSFSGLKMTGSRNLTFDGVTFDYQFKPGDQLLERDFTVQNSHDITFTNMVFDGDVAAGLSEIDDGYAAGFGLQVRGGSGITVQQSEIKGFYKGLSFSGTNDVTVQENDIHGIRSDGINFAAVQGGQILDNHIHDFATNTKLANNHAQADHRDMIQIFTKGTSRPSTDITIDNNRLDMGAGGATQGIWMRNEEVDHGKAGEEMFYRNVTITNNLVINGMANGIGVGETFGLTVTNNTLLPAPGVDWPPTPVIRVQPASRDVQITNNVAKAVNVQDTATKQIRAEGETDTDWTLDRNMTIQTRDPDAPGYLGDLVIATGGGAGSYIPRPGSALDGTGAGSALLAHDPTPDTLTALAVVAEDGARNKLSFDATLSAGPGGILGADARYTWDFGNGQTAEGPAIGYTYPDPGTYTVTLTVEAADGSRDVIQTTVDIAGPDVFSFDGATGVAARIDHGVAKELNTALPLVDLAEGGQAIKMAGDQAIALPRSAFDGYYGASGFGLDLSLRMDDGTANAGQVIRLHKAMVVHVTGKGEVQLELTPDGASKAIKLTTKGAGLQDGHWHDIHIHWNGISGEMEILVDDAVLASHVLEGQLKPLQNWAPSLGSPWHKSFTGEIRQIDLQAEPDAYAAARDLGPQPIRKAEAGWPDIFDFDGTTGTATQFADGTETVLDLDLPLVATGDGGQAIKMVRDGAVALPKSAFADFYGADGFTLDLSLRMDEGSANAGQLLRVHKSVVIHVIHSGEIRLEVIPEGATEAFDIRTKGAGLLDGAWHDVQLRADGVAGVMQILVDGEVLAETAFEGPLKQLEHWEPTLGSTWHQNFTGQIREFDLAALPPTPPEEGPDWPNIFDFDGATATATQFDGSGATALDLDLPLVATGDGGQAIKMERDGAVALPKSAFAGLYGAEGFILDLSLRMDEGSANAGQLLRVHKSVVIHVIHSGEIRLEVIAEGATEAFDIRTKGAGLLDGAWHDVQLRADGVAGVMQILVDGEVLAETAFEGPLKEVDVWDPTLGSTWHRNFTGQIRDFELQAAPEAEDIPTPVDPVSFDALLAHMELQDTIAFGFGASDHILEDGRTVQLDGVSLAEGGFEIGRHVPLEEAARMGVSLVFTPHGTAVEEGQLLAQGDRFSVAFEDGKLAISARLADGSSYQVLSDILELEDLTSHRLLVQIDDDTDILRAVIDDEIIFYETGQDFDLGDGTQEAWSLGDPTGGATLTAHIDQVQIFGFGEEWLA
ncbi:PKD domain-containing protein [Actibacterium sp. 188UL27-1]|uniref:right-handed parallel beta-helix repeat-containing protein n=1 Tax=Actibacterium sp. 188UL27-1 TaxID=2786961 RepID=UPI0019566CD7|nr:PKD domain-containing protein [Actibacterium sp. 188UL27-1]MBM7070221.1 right-handed parallel beta-helix repeat-containing protein [Actibacterium sp. 188UL27-1]